MSTTLSPQLHGFSTLPKPLSYLLLRLAFVVPLIAVSWSGGVSFDAWFDRRAEASLSS